MCKYSDGLWEMPAQMLNKHLRVHQNYQEFNYKFSCFLACFEISLKCSETPSGMWFEGQGGVKLKTAKKKVQ